MSDFQGSSRLMRSLNRQRRKDGRSILRRSKKPTPCETKPDCGSEPSVKNCDPCSKSFLARKKAGKAYDIVCNGDECKRVERKAPECADDCSHPSDAPEQTKGIFCAKNQRRLMDKYVAKVRSMLKEFTARRDNLLCEAKNRKAARDGPNDLFEHEKVAVRMYDAVLRAVLSCVDTDKKNTKKNENTDGVLMSNMKASQILCDNELAHDVRMDYVSAVLADVDLMLDSFPRLNKRLRYESEQLKVLVQGIFECYGRHPSFHRLRQVVAVLSDIKPYNTDFDNRAAKTGNSGNVLVQERTGIKNQIRNAYDDAQSLFNAENKYDSD